MSNFSTLAPGGEELVSHWCDAAGGVATTGPRLGALGYWQIPTRLLLQV